MNKKELEMKIRDVIKELNIYNYDIPIMLERIQDLYDLSKELKYE